MAQNHVARTIAEKVFVYVRPKVFNFDCDEPQFFYGSPENERAYNEVPEEKKVSHILQETIADYNKDRPSDMINVIIFNSVIEKTLKVNRAVHQSFANTILVVEVGSGGTEISKMAIKLSKKSEFSLSARDGSYSEDVNV